MQLTWGPVSPAFPKTSKEQGTTHFKLVVQCSFDIIIQPSSSLPFPRHQSTLLHPRLCSPFVSVWTGIYCREAGILRRRRNGMYSNFLAVHGSVDILTSAGETHQAAHGPGIPPPKLAVTQLRRLDALPPRFS